MNSIADRIAHRTNRVRGYWIIWLVAGVITLVAVSGCSSSSSSRRTGVRDSAANLTYEDLPADIGRGFPEARVPRGATISPEEGNSSPDFSMVLEDGRELALSDLRGRPVMLNFWATWCPPCRAEMPDIVKETAGDEDVVVLAVNVQEDLDTVLHRVLNRKVRVKDDDQTMPIRDALMRKLRELALQGDKQALALQRRRCCHLWTAPVLQGVS